jgi:hypothetical protein
MLPAWLGLLAVGPGCAARQQEVKPDASPTAGGGTDRTGAPSVRVEKRGEEKVSAFDLNHDGKPDVWTYTVVAQGGADGKEYDKLVRKELDINFDGKLDISKHYDDKEQVEHESFDLDFDGKVDQTNYYEKGAVVRKERYLDSTNGQPQLWIYYEKGKIARKERDTNSDGKIDYWEYWENDQVDRIGEDLDGDGSVDRWTKNPETAGGG